MKKLLTGKNVLALVGLVALLSVGLLATLLRTGKEVVDKTSPLFEGAAENVGRANPGFGGFSVNWGDKRIVGVDPVNPGPDWTDIFGPGRGASTTSTGSRGQNAPLAKSVEQIAAEQHARPTPTPTRASTPAPGVTSVPPTPTPSKADEFAAAKAEFLKLIGGAGEPSWIFLRSHNVALVREALGGMLAIGYDNASTLRWTSSLESEVAKQYKACFKTRNLDCVAEWNDLLTRNLGSFPELEAWIANLIGASDESDLTALVQVATNTDVENIVKKALQSYYDQVIASRKNQACKKIDSNTAGPKDFAWCFAGRSFSVTVERGTWDKRPGAIGGPGDNIADGDVVTLRDETGAYQLTGPIARTIIRGLKYSTPMVEFLATPSFFDPTKWKLGQDIP